MYCRLPTKWLKVLKMKTANTNQLKTVTFFSGWAKTYERGLADKWFKTVHEAVIRAMVPHPSSNILDIGCGTGRALREFAAIIDSGRLVGVDISDRMIEEAVHKAAGIRNLEFHVGSADHLPFDDESFDHVTSMNAFHHFPDQRKALKEMVRVLKKGGSVYVADITGHTLPFPIAGNKVWNMIEKPFAPQVNALSKRDFVKLFQDAGLCDVKQAPASLGYHKYGRYWLWAGAAQLSAGLFYPMLIATGAAVGLVGAAVSFPYLSKTITTGKKER